MEFWRIDDSQNTYVGVLDLSVGCFFLCSWKLNDQLSAKALKLSVIEEMHSRNRRGEHGDSRQSRFSKNSCRARFIMVLEKAHRTLLEFRVCLQMQVNVAHKAIA